MRHAVKQLIVALAGVASVASVGNGVAHAAAPILKTTGYLRFTPGTPAPFVAGTNYFDPVNGYVPSTTANSASRTVPIGNDVEFGFDDGVTADTADFINGTSLLIKDISTNGASPFRLTVFTNQNHFFDNAAFVINDFNAVFRVNHAGNGLTFVSSGLVSSGPSARTALITFLGANSPAVPEPAAWAMMVIGFGAIGGAMRRSRSRSTPRLSYSL